MKRTMLMFLLGLSGCAGIPDGIVAVKSFDASRYLGTWYEIGRFDHWFERGLINVSATYSMRDDGGIRVVNRGFDPKINKWKEVEGRAYFVSENNIGRLKVVFFWPFYGGYNIIDIDEQNYSYALVCGNSRSYLWILAREPELSGTVISALTQKAENLGFDINKMIYIPQEK